jgi:hypothetical protein
LILARILREQPEKVWPRDGAGVELRAGHAEHIWYVTVCATMSASPVRVARERGIFARLPGWRIDERTSFHADAIGV